MRGNKLPGFLDQAYRHWESIKNRHSTSRGWPKSKTWPVHRLLCYSPGLELLARWVSSETASDQKPAGSWALSSECRGFGLWMKVPRQNISGSNRLEKSTLHSVVLKGHQVCLIYPHSRICSLIWDLEIQMIKNDYREIACICWQLATYKEFYIYHLIESL